MNQSIEKAKGKLETKKAFAESKKSIVAVLREE